MSEGFRLTARPATALPQGFTVMRISGCRVVFGEVPVPDLMMLQHGFSKKAQMSLDLADLIGATFVIGEPEDLQQLRSMDLPVSERRQRDYERAFAMGLHPVAHWLRNGQRGASSNAMCKRIFGVPEDAGIEHPRDPSDLLRCVDMLKATGARDRVALMVGVSPQWLRLVEAWAELEQSLERERAQGNSQQGKAPQTHARMKDLLAGATDIEMERE